MKHYGCTNYFLLSLVSSYSAVTVLAQPNLEGEAQAQLLPSYNVPTFKLADLESGINDLFLKQTLGESGLLAIRVPVDQSHNKNQNPLQSLCPYGDMIDSRIPGGDQIVLDDGVTTRSTIATATMGTNQPLALPQKEIEQVCDANVYSRLEEARDIVSGAAVEAFLPALDRLINFDKEVENQQILSKKGGEDYNSVLEIVEDAVHLEHIHVYNKAAESLKEQSNLDDLALPVDKALDWHTDAGLFLAFLPGQSCNDQLSNQNEDDSFRVMVPDSAQNHKEVEMRAQFPQAKEGEVIVAIMLGTGAEHWLDVNGLELRATKHAVKMRNGEKRIWYGKMFLVSSQAIVQRFPTNLTFSEMRNSVAVYSSNRRYSDNPWSTNEDVSIGCGAGSKKTLPATTVHTNSLAYDSRQRRRRLQHGVKPESCTNSVNGSDFYCWMQCPTVKDNEGLSVQDRLDQGESLYCAHLEVLAESKDLNEAIEACTDEKGVVGGVMDDGCVNIWHPTKEGAFTHLKDGVIKQDAIDLSNTGFYQEKYCYGSTSMYMHGFEWEGSTCIVYLFQSWILTTRAKFVGACLGTILFGILVELVIKQRRVLVESQKVPLLKMAISALLYGIQLAMGYFIMLVVMTYSGPLVLCVVLGLVCGHIICNWKNLFQIGTIDMSTNTTPCCVAEKEIVVKQEMAICTPKKEIEEEMVECCCAEEIDC